MRQAKKDPATKMLFSLDGKDTCAFCWPERWHTFGHVLLSLFLFIMCTECALHKVIILQLFLFRKINMNSRNINAGQERKLFRLIVNEV